MPRRNVAVKVMPSDVRDPELRRMFNAEADVLAHLSAHPAIVTVYQAGISADGRPYIVMEYCPGSLAQRYRLERLPVEEVLSTGVRMAGALESAHRAGLVHRDVKPSNILITTFGAPVLADFGISSSLLRREAEEVLAMSIPWSAPEVIAEQTAGTISSEVWSLGATVYSLLGGAQPVRASRARAEHQGAAAPPYRPRGIHRHPPDGCAGLAPGGARDGDGARPREAVRLGPRVRGGAPAGAGRARPVDHPPGDPRRGVGPRRGAGGLRRLLPPRPGAIAARARRPPQAPAGRGRHLPRA
ncbi:serine/threonine-protein kinase [Microbacterium aurantiacum]|uniref:serine/threonine-protein kinase n=1 Tax=Microbacterium aurantiacum TaxID=162393 RepID=UPI001E560AC7|nr:serine/threonine-protein kinase [Microbacterium chocolatum]